MKSRSPLDQLCEYAIQCIKQNEWAHCEYVPSVRRLAQRWNVGTTTAHRVLKRLTDQHIIYKDPFNGRYRVSTHNQRSYTAVHKGHMSRVDEMVHEFRECILRGDYPFKANAYIQITYLCNRFHASRKIVAAALARLHQTTNLLTRVGRRYRITIPSSLKNQSTVVILLRQYVLSNPLMMRLVQSIESRCQAIGWNRISLCFSTSDLPPSHQIAGIITTPFFITQKNYILDPSIPTVLLNRSGEHISLSSDKFFEICFDHYYGGLSVAEHLREKNHRDIAVFYNVSPRTNWVHARLQAMQSVYTNNKNPDHLSLTFYGVTEKKNPHPYGLRTRLRTYVASITESSTINDVFSWSKYVRNLYSKVENTVSLIHLNDVMAPIFAQAAQHHYDAWVGINDDLTLCAYEYLTSNVVQSPRPYLVSFDNTVNAALYNFSSYDSGYSEMGYRAVECIIRPDLIRKTYGNRVYIKGNFVRRK